VSTTISSAPRPDPDAFIAVAPHWYVTNTGGLLVNGLVARRTGRRWARWIFWGAVALHVGEAVYAYRAARHAGFTRSAPRWTLQTLAVGFPSLLALREARDRLLEVGPEA